jgi:hypothetical protein
MDTHRSDAPVLNLSSRLTDDNQKHCHIDVNNQYKINEKNFTISIKTSNEIDGNEAENLLFKNQKVQVEDKNEHRK